MIALLVGAQPAHAAAAMTASRSSQALDLVNQLKEQHSLLARVEREVSARSEPRLNWVYPSTIEGFQKRHPDLYSSVFRREPPVANRVDPVKMAQFKVAVPPRGSKGSVRSSSSSVYTDLADKLLALVNANKRNESPDVLLEIFGTSRGAP